MQSLISQTTVVVTRPRTAMGRTATTMGGQELRMLAPPLAALPPFHAGPSDDPGFDAYKRGYELILDERWEQAYEHFQEFLKNYTTSSYVDEAQYWSAYALSHIDRQKALDRYTTFIKDYPKSTYYDDAVADLSRLKADAVVVRSGSGGAISIGTTAGSPVKAPRAFAYSFSAGNRSLQRQLRKERMLVDRMRLNGDVGIASLSPPAVKVDQETQLKMDVLYAIGENHEDETSFKKLKTVALDRTQQEPVRLAAMDALTGFTRFDPLPVFVEIARKDTNAHLQDYAIDFIGEDSKDKSKSVDALIDLFTSLPDHRKRQGETILYSIADLGNDRAVDFLTTVALSHRSIELRRDAVYYLGNIGTERSRSALYRILEGK